MAGLFGFLHRFWQISSPPTPQQPKTANALKFGILGAANIAPMALIKPAKLHPEVVVQAVAARDKKKATAYAKKHGIPQVLDSYEDMLNDPTIDAIFIPLPNGLHYEWALKALAKGKHVILEKPSVSNATEAELLFRSPILQGPKAPVLLEAFHYRFHPAWLHFVSLLDQANIAHANVHMPIPKLLFGDDDIRFRYELAGGAMMDLTYTMSILRGVFGSEPEECTGCEVVPMPPPNELCDGSFSGTWTFPNSATAEMHGSLRASVADLLWKEGIYVAVTHKPEVIVPGEYKEVVRTRKVTLHNFVQPALWHRIDLEEETVVRRTDGSGEVLSKTNTKTHKKVYTFQDAGISGHDSKPYWVTYSHQLDAFVDRVRGREGTGAWVDAEDSINQMRMIDMAYEKSSLPVRPTSKFRLTEGGAA
ncbi:hypothetical protein B0H66DRAFT_287428 [Apodospora peruviana]|uniref:D-xylose 1-dehydrogenase (NADP(+), D-xylono-1,5-lactone-forming) n=1 Tax=Apodospora peruviana TaxID=516989 RepID=A0AAE0M1X0_9PEZI|nr:hypothetical protein B0H66DRAFT_287428 [Apodospora peruviana]